MPSFDVVSNIDDHELTNAVDQTNREIGNRFDFKGTDARVEKGDGILTMHAQAEFQLRQIQDILYQRLSKRGIDIKCMELGAVEEANNRARQTITVRQGIDRELAKKIIKMIKDSKLKVQAQVQGEQVRVSGKKRDDLQRIISLLRGADLPLPLQFENFRD
jgi:uncharacterized protein YajQ (UPF0234 family)